MLEAVKSRQDKSLCGSSCDLNVPYCQYNIIYFIFY